MVASLLGARRPELWRMMSIPKTGAPQLDSLVEEGEDDAADLLACLVLLGMLSIDGDDLGHGDAPSAREEIGRGRESGATGSCVVRW